MLRFLALRGNTDDAARALHYDTQKLRKQLGDLALDWIPYVHFGM